MESATRKHLRIISTLLIGITTVCLVYFGGNIVMPIVFSAVVAMFLSPFKNRLQGWGLHKVLASLVCVLTATILVFGLVFILSLESKKIIATLPTEKMGNAINEPGEVIENHSNIELGEYEKYVDEALIKVKTLLMDLVPETLNSIKNTIVFFLTCPIYIFFMLLRSSNLRAFYYECFRNKNKHIGNEVLGEIEETFGAYIKGVIWVILIVSSLTTLGLFLMGIDFALFLGLLAGILTLIPYVGVFISAVIPVGIALLTKDSFWYAGGVVILFTVIQFIEGNIITPKIVGGKVDINPLMIIFGLVLFGSFAGIAGMVITIPVLALIKIIASKIPSWKPLHLLLKA